MVGKLFNKKPLFRNIPDQSLIFFRIVLGAAVLLEMYFLFPETVDTIYVNSPIHFKYHFLGWVKALPRAETHLLCYTIIVSAFFVSIGFLYRASCIVLFCAWSYLTMTDMVKANNHWYLTSLLAMAMAFVPAHRRFSIDSLLFKSVRSLQIRYWHLLFIGFHIALVYFYGGIAKINPDWLQGQPLSTWLRAKQHMVPLIGPYLDVDIVGYSYCYGGLLFDLSVVPLILWPKTRWFGFGLAVLFHVNNMFMFSIGNFPYFMIPATTILLQPDWPKRVFSRIRNRQEDVEKAEDEAPTRHKFIRVILLFYIGFHLLFPFRHLLLEGRASWTEEAHRFSWRMMLRDKASFGVYIVKNLDTEEEFVVEPSTYLPGEYWITGVTTEPEMLLQFAHYIGKQFQKKGMNRVAVYSRIKCSLNFRRYQYLVDPNIDLMQEERRAFTHYPWIMPLNEKLP